MITWFKYRYKYFAFPNIKKTWKHIKYHQICASMKVQEQVLDPNANCLFNIIPRCECRFHWGECVRSCSDVAGTGLDDTAVAFLSVNNNTFTCAAGESCLKTLSLMYVWSHCRESISGTNRNILELIKSMYLICSRFSSKYKFYNIKYIYNHY